MIRSPRGSMQFARQFAPARLVAIGLAALALVSCQIGTGGEQPLVDRAALTVQEMMTQTISQDPRTLLQRAKAVLICPRVFKAGFFFGGEGGSCVMLARSGNGTWSYPAFYDIGSGSFGFQFGLQDSELLLLFMTTRGLNAVMDTQIRLGANASLAVATIGAGVQGSTTTAVGADIVAFAAARGLFGGVSLEGSLMSVRSDENQAYYGQPMAARQIVLQMQGINPGADPLREVLTRYGTTEPPNQPGPPNGAYQGPAGQPPYQPAQPGYAPSAQPSQGPPASYQPPPAPRTYQPANQPPTHAPPSSAPGYAAPQPPSGYQPPPGQYTYPPPSGTGPIQEQPLPPPGR